MVHLAPAQKREYYGLFCRLVFHVVLVYLVLEAFNVGCGGLAVQPDDRVYGRLLQRRQQGIVVVRCGRLAGKVDGVFCRTELRHDILEHLFSGLWVVEQFHAVLLARVGGHDPYPAAVGDYDGIVPGRRGGIGQELAPVEGGLEAFGPEHAALPHHGVEDVVRPCERPGMGRRGLRAPLGPARLYDDDGLLERCSLQGGNETFALGDAFYVDHYDLGLGGTDEVVQYIRLVQVGFVSHGHHRRKPDLVHCGLANERDAEGAALGYDGDVALEHVLGPERGVQGRFRRVDAEDVGAKDAHPVIRRELYDPAFLVAVPYLREPRGYYGYELHILLGALFDRVEHELRGYDDHGHVDIAGVQ